MKKIEGEQVKTSQGLVYCSFENHLKDKTLVLVHGNSSSSGFWGPLAEGLKQHFNILAFDLPGHGRSPVPEKPKETYSFPAYADLLAEIINNFDLKDYYLVGHSLGGHIILETLDRLSGCKGVIIMGTPPFTFPPQPEKAFQMSPQFLSFLQSGSDRAVMESVFKNMLPESKGRFAELLFEDYFKTDPQAREFLIHNLSLGKLTDELKVLQQTKIPLFVVVAEHDQMVNPGYFTEFLPEKELIRISGSGHYAPLEKHEAFGKLILEKFIA